MDTKPPTVSIVIPALRAGHDLPEALRSIADQDYPNIVEVVVAAGDEPSRNAATTHGAKVVDNPSGRTPTALNLAIAASTGEVIVRCDAQSRLPVGYVSRAVRTLAETSADNVGGMQIPIGTNGVERVIATAMSSPLGAGDARYRTGGEPGPAETVYLGVFPRATLTRLGGFDERFDRNQDYELNHRIIESGGTVWFDPKLRVDYRPRRSFAALSRQYFQYGRWKRTMSRLHRGSLRWRQVLPPVLVVGLASCLLLGVVWPLLWLVPAFYLGALYIGVLATVRPWAVSMLAVPIAVATMHLSWGMGFLWPGVTASTPARINPD